MVALATAMASGGPPGIEPGAAPAGATCDTGILSATGVGDDGNVKLPAPATDIVLFALCLFELTVNVFDLCQPLVESRLAAAMGRCAALGELDPGGDSVANDWGWDWPGGDDAASPNVGELFEGRKLVGTGGPALGRGCSGGGSIIPGRTSGPGGNAPLGRGEPPPDDAAGGGPCSLSGKIST